MALQGTTQAIAAGAVTAAVVGAFPAAYQVGISTGWVTSWRVTGKTATGFTVDFAVPAPLGGSTFDWTAGVPVSPDSGASQAVNAGAVTVTINGVFASAYEVALGPAWMTAVDQITKSGTSFIVQFSVPVPVGGSTLDWIAVIPVNTAAVAAVTTPITGASLSVAAGATTLAVPVSGALPSVYEVTVAPGWITDYQITGKTSTGFTINFAVPAPVGGGSVDYIVFGPNTGVVTLADYLDELNDLLHDPNSRFWGNTNPTQKVNYINRAMRQRDLDTGANRQTFSYTLTAQVGDYTLSQVNGRIFDVISIVLIFGQQRCVLDQVGLTDLTALGYRYANNFIGWTRAFARQGPSTIRFGPIPSIAFPTEWDCSIYSLPLINLTDTDPLPYPYTKPVPFYAAYLAKLNERRYQDAEMFRQQYEQELGVAVNARTGRIPDAYAGLGRPRGR